MLLTYNVSPIFDDEDRPVKIWQAYDVPQPVRGAGVADFSPACNLASTGRASGLPVATGSAGAVAAAAAALQAARHHLVVQGGNHGLPNIHSPEVGSPAAAAQRPQAVKEAAADDLGPGGDGCNSVARNDMTKLIAIVSAQYWDCNGFSVYN